MGTRNLTCAVIDGEYKIAQYGQWDGYPDAAGLHLLRVLRETDNQTLESAIRGVVAVQREEIERRWHEAGADGSGMVGLDVADRFNKNGNWHLNRDCGYHILKSVLDGQPEVREPHIEFAADSLFCEWAYVVDLDEGVFEVYEGFQKEPHTEGRFHDLPKAHDDYHPVKLAKSYPLDDLPTDEAFLADLERCEEDAE